MRNVRQYFSITKLPVNDRGLFLYDMMLDGIPIGNHFVYLNLHTIEDKPVLYAIAHWRLDKNKLSVWLHRPIQDGERIAVSYDYQDGGQQQRINAVTRIYGMHNIEHVGDKYLIRLKYAPSTSPVRNGNTCVRIADRKGMYSGWYDVGYSIDGNILNLRIKKGIYKQAWVSYDANIDVTGIENEIRELRDRMLYLEKEYNGRKYGASEPCDDICDFCALLHRTAEDCKSGDAASLCTYWNKPVEWSDVCEHFVCNCHKFGGVDVDE